MLILNCSVLQDEKIPALVFRFSCLWWCWQYFKRLAAREQILNLKKLFEFANSNVAGVTTFFVNSKSIKENISFPWVMEKTLLWTMSWGASKNLLIQQKEIVLPNEQIMPDSFYACSHGDEWYLLLQNYVSVENCDVNIKFFHPYGPAAQFFWPSCEGTCWIPIHNAITKVDPPSSGSTGRFYCFDCD